MLLITGGRVWHVETERAGGGLLSADQLPIATNSSFDLSCFHFRPVETINLPPLVRDAHRPRYWYQLGHDSLETRLSSTSHGFIPIQERFCPEHSDWANQKGSG